MLTQSRDALTAQLVELTQTNEELLAKSEKYDSLKGEMEELDQKYLTVLELLGEKEEKIMELQQDILDIKEAFRTKINSQFQ
jgi:uncharacterized coiled-coil DUF342 family protein